MSRKDIRLKDEDGNILYPASRRDDDGNIIKYTYIKSSYEALIVKSVNIVYAVNTDATEAPDDDEFSPAIPEVGEDEFLWQSLCITYLNNESTYSTKINISTLIK